MIKRNQFFLVLGKIKNLVEALDVRYKEIKIKQHVHLIISGGCYMKQCQVKQLFIK